jgi:hypothetical protein
VELLFILKAIKNSFFLSLSFCLSRSLPQLCAKNNSASPALFVEDEKEEEERRRGGVGLGCYGSS